MTLHQNVLPTLEHRALRYQNSKSYEELEDERLMEEAIDETGTVSCAMCVLTWPPARRGRLAIRVYRDSPRAPPA